MDMDLGKLYADVAALLDARGYGSTSYSIDLEIRNHRHQPAPDVEVKVYLCLPGSNGCCAAGKTTDEALAAVRAALDTIEPPAPPALALTVSLPPVAEPAPVTTPFVPIAANEIAAGDLPF